MNKKQQDRLGYTILVLLGVFFIIIYLIEVNNRNSLDKNGHYTIGYLIKIAQTTKNGKKLYYYYIVNGKKYKGSEPDIEGINFELSQHYYVKYKLTDFSYSKIILDCPVPDNIKYCPTNGWETLPK